MRIRCSWLIPVLCLFALGLSGSQREAAAQYVRPAEVLFVGAPVMLALPHVGDTLRITYRPGSGIATSEVILTNGPQQVRWRPREAGVVTLSTPRGGTQTVSVRFRSVPWGGVIVLLVSGSILFCGALFAFRTLLLSEMRARPFS